VNSTILDPELHRFQPESPIATTNIDPYSSRQPRGRGHEADHEKGTLSLRVYRDRLALRRFFEPLPVEALQDGDEDGLVVVIEVERVNAMTRRDDKPSPLARALPGDSEGLR
jgi:hypothetical protein